MIIGNEPAVCAADCQQIRQDIKRERSLIKKKSLLKQAVEEDCPNDVDIHLSYAFTLERLRKYEQAHGYYQKAALLSQRTSAKAYFGMGDVLLVLNRLEDAIAAYEQGLLIDSDNQRAHKNLAQSKIKRKALAGEQITTKEFAEVMKINPADNQGAGSLTAPVLNLQIQFESDSATLGTKARSQIDMIGRALSKPELSGVRFEIVGHTDNVGDPGFNLSLSKSRAQAVRDYLIKAHQVTSSRLTVLFLGDTRPLVPNTNKENRAINRRVEFKRID
jgi:outer membrane protein OmpA-like peptidoglycan-associated protein